MNGTGTSDRETADARERIERARQWAASGMQLAMHGRLAEAEKELRRAWQQVPEDASVAFNLARVILSLRRPTEALQVVAMGLAANPAAVSDLLLLRAQILLSQQKPAAAIPAFEEAITAAPKNGLAELGLAIALGESGNSDSAAGAARRAILKGADSAGARHVLGRALFGCHHYADAEAEFRHALRLRPGDGESQKALAELVWMRSGNLDKATSELNRGLQANPRATDLRVIKARLIEASGQAAQALIELEEGLRFGSDDVALRLAAAQVALALDAGTALRHAEHAFRIAPRQLPVVAIYGDALFAAGRVPEAAKLASHGLQIKPDNNHSIALLASAWRVMEDPRHAELCNYADFVRVSMLDTPDGWSDLPAYLADLKDALLKLHQLDAHPLEQTLRLGSQIDIALDSSKDPVLRAFSQAIDGPIQRYMATIGMGADVVRRRNTMDYRLNGLWSVRLKPNGHHVNHFHGQGWLSSACYIDLPRHLGEHHGEGWLTFGQPSFPTPMKLEPEYFLKPEQGLLALFPSWMWHGTIPFSGDPADRRLTMAFDVVPA